MLPRIDYLIFGCRKVKLEPDKRTASANALIQNGLTAKINRKGEFYIALSAYKKYEAALSSIPHIVSEPLGFFGFIYASRKRYGAIVGIILMSFLLFLSGLLVWDIRIDTEEEISEEYVESVLREAGLSVGKLWPMLSRSEIEREALEIGKDIGWININKRGTVAYISVKSKSYHDTQVKEKYSNIVAQFDCVIEEITVNRGIAMVKAGDTVKEGELLISGVIPDEFGGGFVHAEGSIKGRISKTVTVEIAKEEEYKEYNNRKLTELKINIFGKGVNIFKIYRNFTGKYDIITSKEYITLFGEYNLPIEVCKFYTENYEIKNRYYTDDELVYIAQERLTEKRAEELANSDLLKIKTFGEFTDTGYKMYSDMVILTEVGRTYQLVS